MASAIALANRKIDLDKAEQIARDSIAALKKRVERDREFYNSEKEFEDRLRTAPAIGHDALGWVLFTQGRMDEAEKELLKAYEISAGNRDNLHHLGRFYEAKNEIARAVQAFPTTWFLDREGRKVFEKVGWSEKLLEEFGWRIEAIR